LFQVFRQHRWCCLDTGVQCQKPWLSDRRNVRRSGDIDDKDTGTLATIDDEVGSLWFLLFKYLADHAEAILLGSGVRRLNRKRNPDQESHDRTLLAGGPSFFDFGAGLKKS
jgi:hypothetical protein